MIYLSTNFSPKNESRDMSQVQIFTAKINGTMCTDYQLIIKNNDTNVNLYDSTKIHLTTSLYDKSILSHSIPANSIANGLNCKWILITYENSNFATSGETFFKSVGLPTLTLTIPVMINSQMYTPVAIYSHPQNISIKKFYFVLYDSNDNVIKNTGYFYSANLTYQFDGFLNNKTYKIECVVTDQDDITVSSGKQTFTVSYSQPNVDITPNTEVLYDKSAIKTTIGKAVQIEGTPTGNISYVYNFIGGNNKALSLNPQIVESDLINTRDSIIYNPLQCQNGNLGSSITINTLATWGIDNSINILQVNEVQIVGNKIYRINEVGKVHYDINVPINFCKSFKIKFQRDFTGIFCSLGSQDEYKVGYNGERFYFNNKGSVCYSVPMDLPIEPVYIIIRPTDVFINNIRLGF